MRSIDVVVWPGTTENTARDPLELVEDYEAQIAHLQALQVQALHRYADRHPGEFLAEEVAVELGWSPQTAQRRLTEARALCDRLPGTVTALRRGEIDWSKALRLLHAVRPLPVEQARKVEDWVLARAAGKTIEHFAACARRRVLAIDPHGAAARAAARRADRRVWWQPLEDGMAEFTADLPAETASAAYARIDLLARRTTTTGDDRTMDQRRADVLADLLLGHGDHGSKGVQVNVTIDAATLAGLREHPARLHGYGPIDPATARRLATDATWRRIITDPTDAGTILDIGSRRYRPPAAMREQVVLRDQRCRFPGCRRAAERADLDHTHAASASGATSQANLGALCRRHHRMKHESNWLLKQTSPGALTWTSPTGTTATVTPEAPETDEPPPF